MLKRNSKKVLDVYAGQIKKDAKQAYLKIHPEASNATARVNASQLLKKPESQLYLKEHKLEAEHTVVDVMQNARKRKDNANFQTLAASTANSLIDRLDGKATQRTESVNTTVTLSLSLKDITANQEVKH